MRIGVTIGKFLPFHNGHKYLIEEARKYCDLLYVLVVAKEGDPISIVTRLDWIDEEFRGNTGIDALPVFQGPQLGDDDTEGWARETIRIVGSVPTIAFTSEEYGPRWAEAMGCEHRYIDPQRRRWPVSGTRMRQDPSMDLLPPQVWATYCPRYLIVGAECTGKTTLARDLEEHAGGIVVEEFGRFYTEAQPVPFLYNWKPADFSVIAKTQRRFEDQAARDASRVWADTNEFTTALFQEAYTGIENIVLRAEGLRHKYAKVILCDLDVPFVQDKTGMRDKGNRAWFHEQYQEAFPDAILVTGNRVERLDQVLDSI
jgi:HTH-type transcriptional repressor of NAD biosynthesis genes